MSYSTNKLSPQRNSPKRLSAGNIGISPIEFGYADNPIAHWNTLNMQVAGAVTPCLYDLTGNYDLLQTTGVKQPTIVTTELSKPVIYFDGSTVAGQGDQLSTPIAIPFNTTDKITVQILIRDLYISGITAMIYGTATSLSTPAVGTFYGGTRNIFPNQLPMTINHMGNVGTSQLRETDFNYSWKLITATHDIALATNEVNGSSNLGLFGTSRPYNSNNTDTAFASLPMILGGITENLVSRYARFYFAEMVIHPRILTEQEQLRQARQILYNYGLLQII